VFQGGVRSVTGAVHLDLYDVTKRCVAISRRDFATSMSQPGLQTSVTAIRAKPGAQENSDLPDKVDAVTAESRNDDR